MAKLRALTLSLAFSRSPQTWSSTLLQMQYRPSGESMIFAVVVNLITRWFVFFCHDSCSNLALLINNEGFSSPIFMPADANINPHASHDMTVSFNVHIQTR
ncbi:hypothetical protein GYMLUDRAFT_242417 [Collybiopsis luxurians FD-317 M1]|uniref:Uncharacterized protein n=1 Tax=Collybiopsis luxurians FD-317 M1 TaxID=944289 RepID=A0A0D0D125_9AGAR|nr:hypothetical protein GYMLUDRAFT_242417 [Collybiopsis luxurians FD-317 M1]